MSHCYQEHCSTIKGQLIYPARHDRLMVLENYNSYILRQKGATECFAKLGKEWQRIIKDVSEAYETEAISRSAISSGGSILKMGKKVTDGETKHCCHIYQYQGR